MSAISSQRINLDSVITYVLLKKLVTPIVRTKAFRMKLVDGAGKQLKEPATDAEKEAYTILDKIVFKIKRLLGGKLGSLFSFMYVGTLSNDYYNKLLVKGTVDQRAEIMRIKTDVRKLGEQYHMPVHELILNIAHEEARREDLPSQEELAELLAAEES
jgi:hypothetical protein